MIYFTISSLYPAQQNRVIYVDNNVNLAYNPLKRTVKFGDGYELSIPITTLQSFTATFSNRALEEIQVIEEYLKILQGNIIPNFSVMGTVLPIVCTSYNIAYQNIDIASLSADFREEAR